MPIGYLSAWHLAHGNYNLRAFLVDFITVEHWPPGPPWFIRDFISLQPDRRCLLPALAHRARTWRAYRLAALAAKPFRLWLGWYLLTLCLYLPLVVPFGASPWIAIGPFAIQLSRIGLYFGYFVLGMLLGAAGTNHGILAKDSGFNRQRPFWIAGCLLAYGAPRAFRSAHRRTRRPGKR